MKIYRNSTQLHFVHLCFCGGWVVQSLVFLNVFVYFNGWHVSSCDFFMFCVAVVLKLFVIDLFGRMSVCYLSLPFWFCKSVTKCCEFYDRKTKFEIVVVVFTTVVYKWRLFPKMAGTTSKYQHYLISNILYWWVLRTIQAVDAILKSNIEHLWEDTAVMCLLDFGDHCLVFYLTLCLERETHLSIYIFVLYTRIHS